MGEHKDARLLAGGQSLIATLNMRLSAPALLIDINGIGGLDGIAQKDGTVEIGALARHAQAERSDLIAKHAPLIARAMPHIGHAAIRNRGTLGGSIAFADPAAELPACLLALDGEIEATGPKGKRTIKAEDFFKGLFETALGPQDVLTAIRVPAAAKDTRVGFAELARRHGDYAIVGLAASARADGKGSPMCGWLISASAPRRCAPKKPKRRWRAAMSMPRSPRSISTRRTTCRRRPRSRSISPACCCAVWPSS